MEEVLVEARGLARHFGPVRAVDGIDLEIRSGEIFGLLGPNGAGKTTVLRILAGVLRPQAGEVRVLGKDPFGKDPSWRSGIGLVPQEDLALERVRGIEFLEFLFRVFNLKSFDSARLAELQKAFRVDFLDQFVETYSPGMKRKLLLLSVLAREPKVYLLDEPSRGLDPEAAGLLWEILKERAGAGAAVFLSTHILERAEKVCHRAGILASGRILAQGTLEELRAGAGGARDLEETYLRLAGRKPPSEPAPVEERP